MILQKGNERFPETSKDVEDVETIRYLYKMLCEEALKHPYAVGLAAPQLGYPFRVFIYLSNDHTWKCVANPTFTIPHNSKKVLGVEGCLSVKDIVGLVSREDKIKVSYQDENGKYVINRRVTGYLARIFQHEIDHFNGQFFDDIAIEIGDREGNTNDV